MGAGSLFILAKVWLFSFAPAGRDQAMRDRQKEWEREMRGFVDMDNSKIREPLKQNEQSQAFNKTE